jgi:phage terminase large subunit GpA-like protein
MLPCPACKVWVAPERENRVGWQEAESQVSARSHGAFACPACGEFWTDEQRIEANRSGKLVHGEQTFEADGQVCTDAPATDTLGFRWSGVHNLFLTAGDIAADEWRASRSADEENAERETRQFVWCLPLAPSKFEETALDAHQLVGRMTDLPRGVVPATAKWLTIGVDLGKYLIHWIAVAW